MALPQGCGRSGSEGGNLDSPALQQAALLSSSQPEGGPCGHTKESDRNATASRDEAVAAGVGVVYEASDNVAVGCQYQVNGQVIMNFLSQGFPHPQPARLGTTSLAEATLVPQTISAQQVKELIHGLPAGQLLLLILRLFLLVVLASVERMVSRCREFLDPVSLLNVPLYLQAQPLCLTLKSPFQGHSFM